jgi:OOP family OmpA-OmpF porin
MNTNTKGEVMRSKKALVAALIGASAALAAPAAFAQARAQAADTGWYLGGAFGQSSADCQVSGGSCDDKDTAWKIFGGYQINRNFAVELGYANLGEISVSALGQTFNLETTSWDLVGVGSFPLANQFSIYGKLGFHRSETEVGSAKDDGTGLTYGLGVRYDFSRNLGVLGEWQRYGKVSTPAATSGPVSITSGEGDIDLLSVGVVWKF